MNIKQKITTAIATGAMLMTMAAPASFAASNITIKGNGFWSKNHVFSFSSSKKVVRQRNNTNVNTTVVSKSNTGGNKSSFNTGGSNSITTGNTTTNTTVNVAAGSNYNSGEGCCCDGEGETTVTIQGNGALSHNGALVAESCKDIVNQSNKTVVNTTIVSSSNTGGNSSNFNTGGEGNTTDTGNTSTTAGVTVIGSANTNSDSGLEL